MHTSFNFHHTPNHSHFTDEKGQDLERLRTFFRGPQETSGRAWVCITLRLKLLIKTYTASRPGHLLF